MASAARLDVVSVTPSPAFSSQHTPPQRLNALATERDEKHELTGAAPRIALLTMAPGEAYWTRFGHNALLVVDADDASETVYNYGIFDFDQPDFLSRFLRGHMRYRLAAMPAAWDLPHYVEEGREIVVQWLALDPEQARQLGMFLANNALPRNAEYDYHYFQDNCSTRVRDALDHALGGALHNQTISRSRGFTWRMHAARLSAPNRWLWLGIDIGLGPRADQRLSAWDEMFVPMVMRDYLRGIRVQGVGGWHALTEEELLWSPARLPPPPELPPDPFWVFLGGGLLVGALLLWLLGSHRRASPARRSGAVLAGLFWLLSGLAGMVLLILWLATEHLFAHRNENLFLLNPLSLALLPTAWALWRGRVIASGQMKLVLALAGLATLGFVTKGLPFFIQHNGHWIALFLPIHLALAISLRGRINTGV